MIKTSIVALCFVRLLMIVLYYFHLHNNIQFHKNISTVLSLVHDVFFSSQTFFLKTGSNQIQNYKVKGMIRKSPGCKVCLRKVHGLMFRKTVQYLQPKVMSDEDQLKRA